jgi:hypothetical protein
VSRYVLPPGEVTRLALEPLKQLKKKDLHLAGPGDEVPAR